MIKNNRLQRTLLYKNCIQKEINFSTNTPLPPYSNSNIYSSQPRSKSGVLNSNKALPSCLASRISKSIYSRQKNSKHHIHEYIAWKPIIRRSPREGTDNFSILRKSYPPIIMKLSKKLNSLLSGMCESHPTHKIMIKKVKWDKRLDAAYPWQNLESIQQTSSIISRDRHSPARSLISHEIFPLTTICRACCDVKKLVEWIRGELCVFSLYRLLVLTIGGVSSTDTREDAYIKLEK